MPTDAIPSSWPLLDVDALYVNGWLEDCKGALTMTTNDRTKTEILAIIAQRNASADYERGKLHALNVMRTLGMDAAERDAFALNMSTAPWEYVRGYFEAVNAAKHPSYNRNASAHS